MYQKSFHKKVANFCSKMMNHLCNPEKCQLSVSDSNKFNKKTDLIKKQFCNNNYNMKKFKGKLNVCLEQKMLK